MFREFVLLLIAVSVLPARGEPLLDLFPNKCSICTILATADRPGFSQYKFFVFRSKEAKVAANTQLFKQGARNVWVEAPTPYACRPLPPFGAVCTIWGSFEPVYRTYTFCTDQEKYQQNIRLINEANEANLNIYKAYVDAPLFMCQGF